MKHVNNGKCDKCEELMMKFPNAHQGLWQWFQGLQKKHPESHISCFGRNSADQEDAFRKGTSKAHYGQSSHNYSCAIDIFRLTHLGAEWPKSYFTNEIQTELIKHNTDASKGFIINWYGKIGSKFYELPHFEVENWKELVKEGKAHLVEPDPSKIVEQKPVVPVLTDIKVVDIFKKS